MSAAAARICPFCRSATTADAVVCWLCQSRLPPVTERSVASQVAAPLAGRQAVADGLPQGSREAPSKTEPDFVLWSVGTFLSCVVMAMVVLDFALLGGFGGAALAAIASAPVVIALGSMMWLRRPGRPEGGPLSSVQGVLGGVSIAVTVMLSVVFVICLMATALIVLLFILCSGSMH